MPFYVATPLETKQQIVEMKASGIGVPEICKTLAIGKSTVYRILKELAPESTRPYETASLDDKKEEILDLCAQGYGARRIKKILDLRCSADSIWKFLQRFGVNQGRRKPSLRFQDDAIALYQSGHGCVTISRNLGLSKFATLSLLHEAHINLRPKRKPSVRDRRERDKLFLAHQNNFDRIAHQAAGRYLHLGITFEDFRQEIYVAALRAAELWRADGVATFRTYASRWAEFAVIGLVTAAIENKQITKLRDFR